MVNDSIRISRDSVNAPGSPEPFVTDLGGAWEGAVALAVDSHWIYFSDAENVQIERASVFTGQVDPSWVVHLDTNTYGARGLAVDGQYICWTQLSHHDGQIERATLAGPGQPELLVELGQGIAPTGIAVNSQYVYWTSERQLYKPANSVPQQSELESAAIGRAAPDGQSPDLAVIPLGANDRPRGMANDGDHIYWADEIPDFGTPVMFANLDGWPLAQDQAYGELVPLANDPTSVAVDPTAGPPVQPPLPPPTTTTTTTTTTAPTPAPPTAIADAAGVTGPMSATLHGRVGPNGEATYYHFDYGLTTGYGQRVPATDFGVGSGTSLSAVSASLTSLKPRTTYHYRVVATSAGGTTYSGDQSFTTSASCRDWVGPISRINLKKTAITRNGIHVVGTTTDRGGCTTNVLNARDRGGVAKVMISFALQNGHVNTPLKAGMRWGKPVTVHVWTYNFVAKGKHNWTFDAKVKLQPGLYRVFAMGYDMRGNQEPYDPKMRNGILIRLK